MPPKRRQRSSSRGRNSGTPRTPRKQSKSPKQKSRSSRNESRSPTRQSFDRPSTSRVTERKKRRRRRVFQEIRNQQKSTKLCIRKLPFSRLVREIQQRINSRITHWQVEAIAAIQEAAEAYLVRFLEDCNDAAMFSNRVTIMQKDFQFINRLRGKH